MSEPLKPLTPDLKALLANEANAEAPAGAQDRVYHRVETTLGLVGAVSLGASATASAAKTTGSAAVAAAAAKGSAPFLATLGGKIAVTVLAASTAVGVGVGVKVVMTAPPAVTAPAPSKVVPVERQAIGESVPAEVAPAEVVAEPEVAAPAKASAPKKVRRNRERVEATHDEAMVVTGDLPATLAQERVLLEHARAALMENEPKVALEYLNQHQQKYPNAQLTEERESLAIRALVASGRRSDAEVRFARFRRDYPESIFMRAVSDLLRAK